MYFVEIEAKNYEKCANCIQFYLGGFIFTKNRKAE